MAITRADTGIPLSTELLPQNASNPLAYPILLSAVIPNGTNQVVATFNTPCSDSGGPLGSYTGDAILRECDIADLTIGVAATQAGDGTITYDVQELLTPSTVYGFTAGGAAFTTCTIPGPELVAFGDFTTVSQVDYDANWADISINGGTSALEVGNGVRLIDNGPFESGRIEQSVAIVAGNQYEIVVDVLEKNLAGSIFIILGEDAVPLITITTTGITTQTVTAGAVDTLLRIYTDVLADADNWLIGSISVKDA